MIGVILTPRESPESTPRPNSTNSGYSRSSLERVIELKGNNFIEVVYHFYLYVDMLLEPAVMLLEPAIRNVSSLIQLEEWTARS